MEPFDGADTVVTRSSIHQLWNVNGGRLETSRVFFVTDAYGSLAVEACIVVMMWCARSNCEKLRTFWSNVNENSEMTKITTALFFTIPPCIFSTRNIYYEKGKIFRHLLHLYTVLLPRKILATNKKIIKELHSTIFEIK